MKSKEQRPRCSDCCCPNMTDVLKVNDECGECPAGLGSTIYFAPVGKMDMIVAKPITNTDEIYKIDLDDNGGGMTKEHKGGFSITDTFTIEGKMSDELKRLLFPHVRLPRKEKKRCINRVLRDKKTLIHILVCSMIDRSTTLNEIAAAMFRDKPRIEQEYKIILSLNEAEWHTANTLLKRIYKHRRKLLTRLWQGHKYDVKTDCVLRDKEYNIKRWAYIEDLLAL